MYPLICTVWACPKQANPIIQAIITILMLCVVLKATQEIEGPTDSHHIKLLYTLKHLILPHA